MIQAVAKRLIHGARSRRFCACVVGDGDLAEDVVEPAALDEDLVDRDGLVTQQRGDGRRLSAPFLGSARSWTCPLTLRQRFDLGDAAVRLEQPDGRIGAVLGNADRDGAVYVEPAEQIFGGAVGDDAPRD